MAATSVLAVVAGTSGANAQVSSDVMKALQEMQQQIQAQQKVLDSQQQRLQSQDREIETLKRQLAAPAAPPAAPAVIAQPPGAPPVQVVQQPARPKPTVASAVVPLQYLPVGIPNEDTGHVIPGLGIGPVTIQPYGTLRGDVIRDSSSPYGFHFPLPGFNPVTNGPTKFPEFHITANDSILGTSVAWHDGQRDLFISGRAEMDFDGSYAVSSSPTTLDRPSPELRIAYGRVDWQIQDGTSVFLLGGQDWTPFGSSVLPNYLEPQLMGGGFGTIWNRLPQVRVGFNQHIGPFQIQPEFAVVQPTDGNVPADLTVQSGPLAGTPVPGNEGIRNQLMFGERQGSDSDRPNLQARIVGQVQLDPEPGVPPAQIILSGMEGERKAIVLANQIPAAFAAAFPNGASVKNDTYGVNAQVDLPTRWATLLGSFYSGRGLRTFYGGQLFAEFNNTPGLTGTATAQTVDGASTLVFGIRNGVRVVANQLEPRAQGGFINLGLPISRWFDADPEGWNGGWQFYVHYGLDKVNRRDVLRLGGGRYKGTVFGGTLVYQLVPNVNFAIEESYWETRALPLVATGLFPAFNGSPTSRWYDYRTMFSTIFDF